MVTFACSGRRKWLTLYYGRMYSLDVFSQTSQIIKGRNIQRVLKLDSMKKDPYRAR